MNEIVFTIIKSIQNISKNKFFGVTTLVDVLKGYESKKIFDNQLHSIDEYGKLKNMSSESIAKIVEWMITEHFILKTKGRYPVLHSTYEGLHYSEYITSQKLIKLKKVLEEEVILWK